MTFSINGVSFVPPTVPVLLQILSGTQDASDLLPAGSVYGLTGGATIEISLPGGVVGGGVSSLPTLPRQLMTFTCSRSIRSIFMV